MSVVMTSTLPLSLPVSYTMLLLWYSIEMGQVWAWYNAHLRWYDEGGHDEHVAFKSASQYAAGLNAFAASARVWARNHFEPLHKALWQYHSTQA